MNIPPPQGPTIPSSTNFLSNFTRILKVTESIEGNSFSSPNPATPNINTTLSGGTLSNLNNPVLDSQGATYAYAEAHGGTGNPGGPAKSIQYNNAGVFDGSSYLTFDKTTNTLMANNISNGTVTIGSGTISGLSNPTSGQQAATKNYVDNNTALTITTVNTVGATTYSAANIVNGIIYRNTQTSGTTTDSLPTAAQIVAASNASVGTTLTFSIKNISADYTNIVTFTPGAGITVGSSQNIFAGYQYSAIMIVTNVTLGSEALTIYTVSNSITNTTNWDIVIGALATIVKVVRVTDFMALFNVPTDITSITTPVIYNSNVSKRIVYVNPTTVGNNIILMDKPDAFMGVIPSSNFIIGPFIWTTGGMDFYVINESSTVGANLVLQGTTGNIPWTIDPNSNMKIPPGYTGWFMVALTVTDYPEISSLTSARIYTLGIFPSS